jgi:hypothetical protein
MNYVRPIGSPPVCGSTKLRRAGITSGSSFEDGTPPAGQPDPIGMAVGQRVGEFLPAPAGGIDMQPGDLSPDAIVAVAELGTLDGSLAAALLLIEPADHQVHLPLDLPVGMVIRAETVRPLALKNSPPKNGRILRDASSKSIPAYREHGCDPGHS